MGFLQSYRRLSRNQKVIIGLLGVVIGWYGPSVMSYIFLESGTLKEESKPRPLK